MNARETVLLPNAVETDTTDETYFVGHGEFLLAVFGDELADARPVVVSFDGNPASVPAKVWFGRPWQGKPPGFTSLPASANNYFSLAVFRPDEAGNFRRQKSRFQALHAVMLDDVGTKVAIERQTLPPSWLLETSAGNHQAGYLLREPLTDGLAADRLMNAIVAAGLCDPGANGPRARLARLPVGVNGKHTPPFRCRMVEWSPELRYSVDELVDGLQLKVVEPAGFVGFQCAEREKCPPIRQALIDRLNLAVPERLRRLNNWLLWRKQERPGQTRFDKIPVYASGINRHGEQGSPGDRAQLVDFDHAVQALRRGGFDGLGLAMLGDGYTGLDFDDCIDDAGTIKPEVLTLIEGTYAEKSPSGKGIRAFYRGALDPALADRKQHTAGIETFVGKGFLTITGARINGADIADLPEAVTSALAAMLGDDTRGQDRHERLKQAESDDPVLTRMAERGMVIKNCGSGKFGIICPFESGHTIPGGDSSTVYFLPNFNGYASGRLHCMHSHCLERPQSDFLKALGLETPDAALASLAKLSPVEYDRCREANAKQLGIRVATLDKEVIRLRGDNEANDGKSGTAVVFDEPEPWPEPVDGAKLLDELAGIFSRYVLLPKGAEIILALWALHTWLHDAATVSVLLAIISPEKRCGKTTLLGLLKKLARRAIFASNITAAALYRTTDMLKPTLLVDEADTFLKDSEELRGVINSGEKRCDGVIRLVGDDHEPRFFSTWAPKCIALIGNLPGTLADRSIVVSMRRKRPGEKAERPKRSDTFLDLKRRIARWASDNEQTITSADIEAPDNLNDRAADHWRELLAIAQAAGNTVAKAGDLTWLERARAHAKTLGDGDDVDENAGVQLLADIRQFFKDSGKDVLFSIDLAAHLATLAERPWPEWRHAKPITQRQIARLLRPFDIQTETIREGDKRLKGYALKSFDDAFSRYLPNSSVPAVTMNENKDVGENRSVTNHNLVTDRKQDKRLINDVCHGGTDENTQKAEVMGMQAGNEDIDEAELWETDRPAYERLQAEKTRCAFVNRAEKMRPLALMNTKDVDENGMVEF